jgi:hypothetical protein
MERRHIILIFIIILLLIGGSITALVRHQDQDNEPDNTPTETNQNVQTPTTEPAPQVDPRGKNPSSENNTPPAPTTPPPTPTIRQYTNSTYGIVLPYPKNWKLCSGVLTNKGATTAQGLALFSGNEQPCSAHSTPAYGVALSEEITLGRAFPTMESFRNGLEGAKKNPDRMLWVPGTNAPVLEVGETQNTIFNGIPVTQIAEGDRLGVYFYRGKLLKLTYFTSSGHTHRAAAFDLIAGLRILGRVSSTSTTIPSSAY